MSIVLAATFLAIATPFADLLLITFPLTVQRATRDCTFSVGYSWRSLCPDRGGRYIVLPGVKRRPGEAYFGAAAGGLWKTANVGDDCPFAFDTEHPALSADAQRSEFLR